MQKSRIAFRFKTVSNQISAISKFENEITLYNIIKKDVIVTSGRDIYSMGPDNQ
ncbi:MAG TPA: hypothetical protein PLY70_11480 [Saprospiraceae bacterium]|nr:hypothetical protein [Saprospiraceae bacterium]HPN70609.1 hypothetical protein [Saprospiraceae bacterium]